MKQTAKMSQASSPNNKLINTLLLKSKNPSQYTIQSPAFAEALYPHKNSSIDLTKLATLMKQQKVKQSSSEGSKDSMTQLIAKARAIAMSAKTPQRPIHIRNDSAQVRRVNKEAEVARPKAIDTKLINKTAFTFEYLIGRGGFGKVWKVKRTGQQFA